MAAEFKVVGLADLEQALREMPDKLINSALRGGVRAASRVVQVEARGNIHQVSGELAKSVRVRSPRIKGDYVNGGVTAGNAKAFYAHMVEFGTAAHVIEAKPGKALAVGGGLVAKVHHPGAKKKPFMRPAIDTQAQAAVQAFADYVGGRIEREQLNQTDPNA